LRHWHYTSANRLVEKKVREPTFVDVTLTEHEVALVVAALRNWQMDILDEDLEDAFMGHFRLHRPLSEQDIDSLCLRFQFDESQGHLTQ
jgi:hypothetical protein